MSRVRPPVEDRSSRGWLRLVLACVALLAVGGVLALLAGPDDGLPTVPPVGETVVDERVPQAARPAAAPAPEEAPSAKAAVAAPESLVDPREPDRTGAVGDALAGSNTAAPAVEPSPGVRPLSFHGTLVSKAARRPIENARVVVADILGKPIARLRTDAAGQFHFQAESELESLSCHAEIEADGFEARRVDFTEAHATRDTALVIELSRGASLSGRLTDARGRPKCGVVIQVEAFNPGMATATKKHPEGWQSGVDEAGRYRIVGLPSGVSLELVVFEGPPADPEAKTLRGSKHRFRTDLPLARRELMLASGEQRVVDIAIPDSVVVVGSVTDQHGRPVAGVDVAVGCESRFWRTSRRATTDARGGFRIERVPAGDWLLRAIPDEQAALDDRVVNLGVRLAITGSSPEVRQDFTVYRGLCIRGTVVNTEGAGIAGAHVIAMTRAEPPHIVWTESDDEGRFVLGPLVLREYGVRAHAPHRVNLIESEKVQVRAGTEGVTLPMAAGGIVEVHVRGNTTQDRVLGGVDALSRESDHSLSALDTRDGPVGDRFVFRGLKNETYDFYAHTSGGRVGAVGGVRARAGAPGRTVDLALAPGGSLTLVVAEGGCIVDLRDHGGTRFFRVRVFAGMPSRFCVPAGEIRIDVHKKDAATRRRTVRVAAGKEVTVSL